MGWGSLGRDIIAAENIRYSKFLRAKEQTLHFKCLDLSPIVKKTLGKSLLIRVRKVASATQ